ncbi:MAG: DNA sulfur modification protein DndD [Victivallaceae bacterium]|nr:DNA sulfur modification protein DndD [Victivallaceae bacterium]
MIIDQLTFHNFGVYKSRQTVILTPPDQDKPLILFGGLNGAGKTTLLDALQLVLYGKQANCSKRGKQSYDKFLLNSISHNCSSEEGATLELIFRQHSEGVETKYKIIRSWTPTPKGIRKSLIVIRNDKKDLLLTENWQEMVETIIPSQIANLFFFDGEKIAEIADLENSSRFLTTGINSLLGLNVIERLKTDLSVLEHRKSTEIKNEVDQKQIRDAEEKLKSLKKEQEKLIQRRNALLLEFEKTNRAIKRLIKKYKKAGGEHFDNRNELEQQKQLLREEVKHFENKLREKAAGALPLSLVSHLLQDILSQAEKEEEARKSQILVDTLSYRDNKLLKIMNKSKADTSIIKTVTKYLETDRNKQEKQAASTPLYLNMNKAGTDQVKTLLETTLPTEKAETQKLLVLLETAKENLDKTEQLIHAIPDPANIKEISEERRNLLVSQEQISLKIEAVDNERDEKRNRLKTQEQQVIRIIESAADEELEYENARRMIIHIRQIQQVCETFQKRILERNLEHLEQLILESFQTLLRKDSFLDGLKINPVDFSLTLYGNKNDIIPPDYLSAGERQLLAVSMLWGLARASGRPLPAIIDTPLGRLDSTHRHNLVEHYFPNASHQVILLSTDEEINTGHLDKLKSSIGHTYRLDYNDNTKSTIIKQGYFWENM